jgi:hypothetical protein
MSTLPVIRLELSVDALRCHVVHELVQEEDEEREDDA